MIFSKSEKARFSGAARRMLPVAIGPIFSVAELWFPTLTLRATRRIIKFFKAPPEFSQRRHACENSDNSPAPEIVLRKPARWAPRQAQWQMMLNGNRSPDTSSPKTETTRIDAYVNHVSLAPAPQASAEVARSSPGEKLPQPQRRQTGGRVAVATTISSSERVTS